MNTKQRNEAGSIIPLAALLVSVIIGMAALGLEITYGSASLEQSRHNAKLAAIAALEAYASDDSDNETTRRASALTRANEILQANYIVADRSQAANALTLDGSNGTPQLVAGRWYYQQIDANDPCAGDYPCFVTVPPDETANAFQIVGELFDPVPARFARVFGFKQLYNFSVNAIATMVPRQGCFLVDISASMVRETHPLDLTDPDNSKQFAFDLSDANHSAQWTQMENNYLNRSDGSPADQANPTIHYRSDYRKFRVFTDGQQSRWQKKYHPDGNKEPFFSSSALSSNRYMIDIFRDSNHQGPEPLRTVFEGLRTALQKFKDRKVAGDKACIIFYDNALAWPRVVKLTDDFDYLLSLTDFSIPTNGVIDLGSGFGLMMRHGLFPAAGSTTDMRLALINALGQFSDPVVSGFDESVPVSNFIVLIGDGLPNCPNCIPPERIESDYDLNGDGEIDGSDPYVIAHCLEGVIVGTTCDNPDHDANGDGIVDMHDFDFLGEAIGSPNLCNRYTCENTGENYRLAAEQLLQFVKQQVVPLEIPIHVVHVGDHVAPHTVDEFNQTGDACLTDSELRTLTRPFVRGGDANGNELDLQDLINAFDNMSPQNPFYQAADPLYRIATQTLGIWAPLRAPASSSCDCDPSALRRTIDSACPGRSKQEQMNNYMERIMGENPYRIVQERAPLTAP